MKKLLGYVKKYKWYIIIGPFFKLLETLLELLNPILVAKIVDVGVSTGDIGFIVRYGVILIVSNLVMFSFSCISNKCSAATSVRVATDMRLDLFAKVSTLSHAELDKFGTASLVNRMTSDINQIENTISIFMRLMIRVPFLLVGAFVLSLVINIKMSLIFLVLIPIMLIMILIYIKKTNPYFKLIRTKLDNISRGTKENLSGTRVIRAFNKQETEQKRFEHTTADYTDNSIKVSKITSLLNPMIFLLVDAATIALLAIGGWQVNIGSLTQGDIIALIDYVTIITISLLVLSQIIVLFVRTNASLHRINEVLDTVPSVQNPEEKVQDKKQYKALMEFDNVCFNYAFTQHTKSFIKDLSFKIMPNQTIGIIGGTGSGKSTIAHLMTRFYDVTSGEIRFKDRSIKDYSLEDLRSSISVVQQRSTLFSGTIRENMQIRKNDATDEEIIEALKISQAWSFVSEWPNPLDYKIMAGGKNVSGGQMQRLTIARAVIGKPEMLIFDDSSSALDFMTESKLMREIKKLNCARVIISQRATSIKNADLIICLDNGDVVGMGKHNDLMKNCEIYREIYESQSK